MEYMQRRLGQPSKPPYHERDKQQRASHHPHSHSPVSNIQQWLGNAALKQLITSQSFDAANLMKQQGNYTFMPQLLDLIANSYSEEDSQRFSTQFNALTVGQQQAFWYDIISDSSLANDFDMSSWQQDMEKLSQVELQPLEPFQEGNIAELGANRPPYMSSYQGLLSPYRALWQWLNYKGNRQGQQYLLQRLDGLSLPAKQLLLHRLVRKAALSTRALSAELTIKLHEKQWVDWARIEQQLEQLHALSPESIQQQLELAEQTQVASNDNEPAAAVQELEDEQDAADDGIWLALLGGASTTNEQSAPKDELSALYDPEQLSLLLLGSSLASRQQAIPANGDMLIKRLLRLEGTTPEKLEKLRDKRISQLGFSSLKALLQFVILTILEQLEQHARKRKDERYITLLQRMQIMKGNALPNKQQLHQALHKQLL